MTNREVNVSDKTKQTDQPQGQQKTPATASLQSQAQHSGSNLTRRNISPFSSVFSLMPHDLFSMNPFELMRRFTDDMDRAFDSYGLRQNVGNAQGELTNWKPVIEVAQRGDKFIVHAELPGLKKEDVKVELTDDGLIIQGERKREHEEKQGGFYRSERSYGSFYRQIALPENASTEDIQANFNNGILEISVPVPETKSKRREVPINVNSEAQSQAATAKK